MAMLVGAVRAGATDADAFGTTLSAPSQDLSLPPRDPFDIRADLGRPLWLRLPSVAFLALDRAKGERIAVVFDPEPVGPRQGFEPPPVTFAWFDPEPVGPRQDFEPPPMTFAWFDPSPLGPLQMIRTSDPVVAAQPPAPDRDPRSVSSGGPEHTGSTVILRRRY